MTEPSDGRRADLVVLVADLDAERTLRGLLSRPQALGIRPIDVTLYRHPDRDPGCRLRSADFLKPFASGYHHALVVFDHEGSGAEEEAAGDLEASVARSLDAAGWDGRAAALVLEPELEIWVWSDSPEVDVVLGWDCAEPPLRQWLVDEKWLAAGTQKPPRPKEAMKAALRHRRIPSSARLFGELASRVSVRRCVDPAFARFKQKLQLWFGGPSP